MFDAIDSTLLQMKFDADFFGFNRNFLKSIDSKPLWDISQLYVDP